MQDEEDRAAQLAREVRELAASRGDARAELAACIELGQDLLRSPLGEAFVPPHARSTSTARTRRTAARARARRASSATTRALAAALRELGVVAARPDARVVRRRRSTAGEHVPIGCASRPGEALDDILPELPIAPIVTRPPRRFEQALELFERIGDRRGAMSTIIAMGYLNWAPDIHMGSGAGAAHRGDPPAHVAR